PLATGLSDPALQPKFVEQAINALDRNFIFKPSYYYDSSKGRENRHVIGTRQFRAEVGLVNNGTRLKTDLWGYGNYKQGYTWPGRTFEVTRGTPTQVTWTNNLTRRRSRRPLPHLLPVDTNLHWAYSLPDYEQYSIENDGVPIVPHLHGGNTQSASDGLPEAFYSPGWEITGPQWTKKRYTYSNDQAATSLWAHDHCLGITRLNVYAGLASFYIIRDEIDTGKRNNPLGLPADPYELAYVVQDRMFTRSGALFFPAFPGDPFYDDFITAEGAVLPPDLFPGGGPTALAEFFGDHITVNGKIWPKAEVEPRNYRMRLLNGSDSRFLVVRFRAAPSDATDLSSAGAPLPFWVIGSDQGLGTPTSVDTLVISPGERFDVVFDFSQVQHLGSPRVIMENIGGDAPFNGEFGDQLPPEDFFPDRQTDRIMAFDMVKPLDQSVPDTFNPEAISPYAGITTPEDKVRKLALFEGKDEFGRLQPLLGVAEPTLDVEGNLVDGSIAWHMPTTENPDFGATEIWEIYNATGDAHPVHVHLVNFQILGRQEYTADLIEQPVLQHNGTYGIGFRLENIVLGAEVATPPGLVEDAPKDMATALPGTVTRIKMTFNRRGRYVWHCHILSHEDHEMMRILHVGPIGHSDDGGNN
ncbi:MAG: multicopper oxidase family protein, partial [Gammaproteobacteria bacterium]